MDTVRIGIIGAGFVAGLHARVYAGLAGLGAQVAGIASRTQAKAEALAREHAGARVYPDPASLIADPAIDVVDLCVPNHLHMELALAAARAGKHIICEKPLTGYFGPAAPGDGDPAAAPVGETSRTHMLAAALAAADAMVQTAEQHAVKLMYAENWLYSPVIRRAKRLIRASGGAILELRGEESHHGSHAAYAKQWRTTGGGSLIRLGSHPIAAILHLKACEGIWRDGRPITPRSVVADVANLAAVPAVKHAPQSWIVRDWEDVENWATAILTFSDGAKATVAANDICLGGMRDTLDVYLSNARLHCDFSRSTLLQAYAPDPTPFADEYLVEKLETKAGWSFPSVDEEWLLGYHHELADFVEAVRQDRAPLSDGRLGRAVVEVIYSAYLSAAEGRPVAIPAAG